MIHISSRRRTRHPDEAYKYARVIYGVNGFGKAGDFLEAWAAKDAQDDDDQPTEHAEAGR